MPRLAVLGDPVSHSRSPAMQNAALAAVGLDSEWSYEAIRVDAGDFADLVRRLPGEGYAGVNVTIPHKEAALEVADGASARAEEVGAANTLSFSEGRVLAENTDASGIRTAVGAVDGTAGLVIGAGGSARAAVWALRESGLEVHVWNRRAARAEQLARDLAVEAAAAEPELSEFSVIVNTTPIGIGPPGSGAETSLADAEQALKEIPFGADGLSDRQVVVDLAYGSVETPVIAVARAAGARWIDGLEVLVHQGAESFQIWTGIDPPLDVMRRAARADGNPDDDRAHDTPPASTGSG